MTRKAYETFDVCCVENDKKPAYRAEIDNKRNIATEVTGAARSLGNKAPCLTLVSQNHKDRGVI